MSLKLTESWIQFGVATWFSSGVSFPSVSALPLTWSPNLWKVAMKASSTTGAYKGMAVIQDPVFPSRVRLRMDSGSYSSSTYAGPMALYVLDTSAGKRRFGFLLRVLSSAVANQVAFGPGNAGTGAAVSHPAPVSLYACVSFYKAANSTTVQLSHGARGTATALSYTLNTDTDYYVEVEMDTSAGTYRVWIDDYLIIDASMAAAAKTAMLASWGWSVGGYGGGNFVDIKPCCYLSDIYYLMDDGVTPSERLGKTTRVKGELPSADVSVSFDRPTGFTSNFDVVNDGISSAGDPAAYLTGSGVGATDVYAVPLDTYAAQVYAVQVKAIAANFSSAEHRVDAVIKDGNGNTQAATLGTLAGGAPFTPLSAIFTVAPDGSAFTPQNVASANFGYTIAT